MTSRLFTPTRTILGATVVVLALFGLIWGLGSHRAAAEAGTVAEAETHATHQGEGDGVTFTGTREETARLIVHYHAIELSPEQERLKTEALEAIPAPCCNDNSMATCCCPCNLAKASWGLAAWLITEKGYGAEEIGQATRDWLAAANPNGFAGNACYTAGGCARPIHQDGCGGMDDRRVL